MKSKGLRSSLSIVLCALMLTTSVAAQQHVISQDALDQLVSSRVADEDAQRAQVRQVLERPEVARVARQAGIDLTQIKVAVATLEGEELAEVAAQAQQVDEALSGGQSTITMSTTMIIIILLVVILIIVAVS